jgi:imidazolonepropionase-like amidohydrolase
MLVDAGLTPIEALASATSVNAGAFQLNDHGQIAPGKRADLPLVDGDSTPGYRTSATSLRSGSWVFRSIVRITAPS